MSISLQKPNPSCLTSAKLNRQTAMNMERNFEKATTELTSGGISDYGDVDVNLFVNLEVQEDAVKKYNSGNNYNLQRMRSMADQLDQLQHIANDLQQEISLTRSSIGADTRKLNQVAKGMQIKVSNILNASFANEYLFSGPSTLTPAVESIDDSGVTTGGVVTASYYQGAQGTISFSADSVSQIRIDVNASDMGVAELVYAINLCVYATAGDLDRLGYANDLCNSASQDIIRSNTGLKLQMKTLEQANEGLLLEKKNVEAAIMQAGYKTPADAMQRYMDALTSKDIALALITKNDSVRSLIESLR